MQKVPLPKSVILKSLLPPLAIMIILFLYDRNIQNQKTSGESEWINYFSVPDVLSKLNMRERINFS